MTVKHQEENQNFEQVLKTTQKEEKKKDSQKKNGKDFHKNYVPQKSFGFTKKASSKTKITHREN